jgi:hypothetical protein
MGLLTQEEILRLLGLLKLEPVWQDHNYLVAKKRGIGYSDDPEVARIEGKLSIMLSAAAKFEAKAAKKGDS